MLSRVTISPQKQVGGDESRVDDGQTEAAEIAPDLDGPWPASYHVRGGLRAFIPFIDKPVSFWEAAEAAPRQRGVWNSLDVIRSWLDDCDRNHGPFCCAPQHATSTRPGPAWLIDVSRSCLVRAEPGMKYFALSYVWGRSPIRFWASGSNIETLQRQGSFDKPASIPKTIRDAIRLAESLGGQYIWVDCLCILQDDGPEKAYQLNLMGDIYAGAVATIVAASGDSADAGLDGRGCPEGSADKSTVDKNVDIQAPEASSQPESRPPSLDGRRGRLVPTRRSERVMLQQTLQLMGSTWYKRGWTFQEYLFSRRKIVFQGITVNWECGYAARTAEGGPVDASLGPLASISDEPSAQTTYIDSWLPDPHRLSRLIAIYNKRQLTYPEDALDAFTGIITKITKQYVGGFITALPQMFFDAALLWQPYDTMFRRLPRKSPRNDDDVCLPSWSWVGWKGDFNSESWRSTFDFMKGNPNEYVEGDKSVGIWQPTSWRTLSTVKWFRLDKDASRHRIESIGQQYRDLGLQENGEDLPSGWVRSTCADSGQQVFQHVSDTSREFWYPIPLVNPEARGPPHVYCKRLWCQTRHAFLRTGPVFRSEPTSRCACTNLIDERGNQVGVLRYPFRPKAVQAANIQDRPVELVELSAGSVVSREVEKVSFDEWARHGYLPFNDEEIFEFYNVMFIEWDGSIAYRRAVGRVRKTDWERLAVEKIDLTLG